jgi:hypothetical protein
MPDKSDLGLDEFHETIRGGERVLIRRARPEDMALYPDFLRDVSSEDLRLRFFGSITELSAAEIDKLTKLDYRHEMAFIALDEETGQMLGLVRLIDELAHRSRVTGSAGSLCSVSSIMRKRRGCGACAAMCWRKIPQCCKCAPNSVSTRRT